MRTISFTTSVPSPSPPARRRERRRALSYKEELSSDARMAVIESLSEKEAKGENPGARCQQEHPFLSAGDDLVEFFHQPFLK